MLAKSNAKRTADIKKQLGFVGAQAPEKNLYKQSMQDS